MWTESSKGPNIHVRWYSANSKAFVALHSMQWYNFKSSRIQPPSTGSKKITAICFKISLSMYVIVNDQI